MTTTIFGTLNEEGRQVREPAHDLEPSRDVPAQLIWMWMSTAFWMSVVLLAITVVYAIVTVVKPAG